MKIANTRQFVQSSLPTYFILKCGWYKALKTFVEIYGVLKTAVQFCSVGCSMPVRCTYHCVCLSQTHVLPWLGRYEVLRLHSNLVVWPLVVVQVTYVALD